MGNTSAWVESESATVQTTVTKYYYLAGQRVAMRQGSALTYLYGDHLGSTSLITNASGAVVAETRYLPYGQVHWQWGASQTDYTFTGQRMDGFGLMDYNARYYDPLLGRFISPDSIIPQPGSPLAWDRYGYVNSNPITKVDPSGHKACDDFDENGNCISYRINKETEHQSIVLFQDNTGSWSDYPEACQSVITAVYQMGGKLASTLNQILRNLIRTGEFEGDYNRYSAEEAFLLINGGPITFTLMLNLQGYAGEANYQGGINIYLPNWSAEHPRLILHELSHRLENVLGIKGTVTLPTNLRRSNNNYGDDETGFNGFAGGKYDWQFTLPEQLAFDYETIADMGIGWVTGEWGPSTLGDERREFMNSLLVDYLQPYILK